MNFTPTCTRARTWNELLAQHALGRQLVEHLRHVDGRVVGEVLGEAAHVVRLDREVDLLGQRLAELRDQPGGRVAAQLGDLRLGDLRHPLEDRQVGPDHPVEVRALDLEHDLLPALERRAVDLRDRGGRQRLLLELAEHVVDLSAELRLDQLADPRRVERGDLVLQLAQLDHQAHRDQVGPGGHHLPQLDEGRTELLQRQPDPLLGAQLVHVGVDAADQLRLDPVQDGVDSDPGDDVAEPVLEQHPADLREPLQAANPLRDGGDAHGRQG